MAASGVKDRKKRPVNGRWSKPAMAVRALLDFPDLCRLPGAGAVERHTEIRTVLKELPTGINNEGNPAVVVGNHDYQGDLPDNADGFSDADSTSSAKKKRTSSISATPRSPTSSACSAPTATPRARERELQQRFEAWRRAPSLLATRGLGKLA
jgi:hypothetical protein